MLNLYFIGYGITDRLKLSPEQLTNIEDTDSTSDDNTDIEQELDDIKNENDIHSDEMKSGKEDL